MRIAPSLCLLLFGTHFFACSGAIGDRRAGPSVPKPAENALLNSAVDPRATPGPSGENASHDTRDTVVFDGKNHIRRTGWKTPPKKDTDIDESYDQGDVMYLTESGRRVRTNTVLYLYRTPWWHLQDFHYDRGDLDYLKGKLEVVSFMEMSANGKIFLYSISVETVVPVPSNSLDHQDPFGYRILDRDGDRIFETLLARDAEIVVPNWVLR